MGQENNQEIGKIKTSQQGKEYFELKKKLVGLLPQLELLALALNFWLGVVVHEDHVMSVYY